MEVMARLDPDVARAKCNNFLIEGSNRGESLHIDRDKGNATRREKEKKRSNMRQAPDKLQDSEKGDEQAEELPFTWVYSFKLLGVVLDCEWNFGQHLAEAKAAAVRRFGVLTEAGNALRGMETRTLSITGHSLVDSVIIYGLAAAGRGWEENGAGQLDRAVLNETARKVAGTNITIWLETLMILSDMRNATNHYILKTANVPDRILRAEGAAARRSAIESIKDEYEVWEDETEQEELPTLMQLEEGSVNNTESATQGGMIKGSYKQGKETTHWVAMKRKMERKKDMEVQNSFFHTTEATIKNTGIRKELAYQRIPNASGYDAALSIVSRTRWDPGVTYAEVLYAAECGSRIRRDKIWWEMGNGKEDAEDKEDRDKNRSTIGMFSAPIRNRDYVIGATAIENGTMGKGRWSHVMGAKFSDDPFCQAGVNLTVSLRKPIAGEWGAITGDRSNQTIRVYTAYGHDLTTKQKMR